MHPYKPIVLLCYQTLHLSLVNFRATIFLVKPLRFYCPAWRAIKSTHFVKSPYIPLLFVEVTYICVHRNSYRTTDLRVCNGLVAHRKFGAPTASRWRWVGSRVHACSSTRPQFWTRAHHATAQGHSAVLGAQPLAAAKSCCPISVCLQIGELAHAARPNFWGSRRGWGVLVEQQHPVLQV